MLKLERLPKSCWHQLDCVQEVVAGMNSVVIAQLVGSMREFMGKNGLFHCEQLGEFSLSVFVFGPAQKIESSLGGTESGCSDFSWSGSCLVFSTRDRIAIV